MVRKPILSAMDWNPKETDELPILFGSNLLGKMGQIQADLNWRMIDFCKIHQIVYKEINIIERGLDNVELDQLSSDVDDFENLRKIRRMDAIFGRYQQNEKIIGFVDQMTIVGLWSIAEQFLGKIYKSHQIFLREDPTLKVAIPYKWDDFKKVFLENCIELETCENYVNANECRVLNNAIKHDPIVSPKLTQF